MIKDEEPHEESCCEKESWADCVAGALRSEQLIKLLTMTGFVDAKMLNTNHYKTSASTIGATFSARKP